MIGGFERQSTLSSMERYTAQVVDAEFLALPLAEVSAAALNAATSAGAQWADVRIEAGRGGYIGVRDGDPETKTDSREVGLGVRVIVDGCWGFAADPQISVAGAVRAAKSAVALARIAAPIAGAPISMSNEKVIGKAIWSSEWVIDPFSLSLEEKSDLLVEMSHLLLDSKVGNIENVDAGSYFVKEQKHYADILGNELTSQRLRIETEFTATSIDPVSGEFTTLTTLCAPTARGWELMTDGSYDWAGELAELPELLDEKAKAPSVTPGEYDLVIDPTNLWLTIHESIGHATELDRVLGYETNYAGTSFARLADLGTLQYGTKLLNVNGDRSARFGLSSTGFDDEGVATKTFPIISAGVLQDFQSDRASAQQAGRAGSNACAYAEDAYSFPIQRMPNVSMAADANGPDLAAMIAGVEDGLYIKGDDSWSIDMQRNNFQFTGQQFWRIRNGELAGQVKDAAYQSDTRRFWNSLVSVGNESTYHLGGALNCGKGQPGQSAPVSHGAPVARFNKIRVLNTANENADESSNGGIATNGTISLEATEVGGEQR